MNKDVTQSRNQMQNNRPGNVWSNASWLDNFFEADLPSFSGELKYFSPAIDINETADEYLVSADLPGIKEDDIKIECNANQLTISAERKYDSTESKKENRRERFFGTYQRSFTLPQGVDSEKIDAKYEGGVLEIHIPKGEKVKSRRIQIGSSKNLKH